MKYKFLRISLLSAFAVLFGGIASGALQRAVEEGTKLIDFPNSKDGITLVEGGSASFATVKIHENKDAVDCIKFANSGTNNGVTVTVDGGFKAGDKIEIAGAVNIKQSDVEAGKRACVEIYTETDGTQAKTFTTQDFINGQLSADDPVVETFTLESDCDKLVLARNGGTGANVTLLTVSRAIAGDEETTEMEAYDFQELCMDLYANSMFTSNPDPVRDGGDAGFTIGDAVMHYLGDYDELGYTWNQRFAYEYNERGKFTFRNKSNKKDGNCGMFSWDYAHYFSILDLKDGDRVIITIPTVGDGVTFVSENVKGVETGANVANNETYTISTTDETTRLDIRMGKSSLIAKIQIIPAGAEIVPTIKLDKSELTLEIGKTATIKATVDPSMPVQWKSSNEAVATVEDGTITAIAVGEAKITCYWESEVSDKVVEATLAVTVIEPEPPYVIEGKLVKDYDFTTMGDVTLVTGEEAGSIYNAANSKNNKVYYCTNEGLEDLAVQAVLEGNKGWSIVDGKGLYEGSGAGRCAAIAGIKKGQIVEFFYTGATFDTKSDGSDDGIIKEELYNKDGRIIFKAEADGMIGFELTKGNYVEQINIYDDIETGINNVKTQQFENGEVYNLQGQKVNNAQKGIFIINGKKVVLK